MSNKRPIYWLHLSDLHFGARGKEVLHQAIIEFFHAIKKLSTMITNCPDIILISGDLAFSGKPEEYQQADDFLSELLGLLRSIYGNCNPLLICVPGNHDLVRPTDLTALQYDVFNRYAESTDDDQSVRYINDMLWDKKDATIIQSLFPGYLAWWEKRLEELHKRSDIKVHTSHIPGDFCLEINIENTFPICMVGLNSAWLQYNDGNFDGRLSISTRQFQSVLPHSNTQNPLDIFKKYNRALLVMHHPPSMLSPAAQNRFGSEIFVPDRFDMCLYGHMHTGRARQTAVSGGAARYEFQSPSLCGLDFYGKKKEERAFGFSAGCIKQDGEIRVWPYNRVSLAGGEHAFLWDQSFGDGAEHKDGVLLRPSITTAPIEPVPDLSAISIEGALLHVTLIDIQRAEQKQVPSVKFLNNLITEIGEKNSLLGRLKRIDYSWDGKFTWLLSRAKDQSWNTLLGQALQIALEVSTSIKNQSAKLSDPDWVPQVGIAIHVEYDAHNIEDGMPESGLVGEGIDYVHKMLPQPVRPYIILSSEAHRYLRYVLSNQNAISALINPIDLGLSKKEHLRTEINRWTIPDHKQQTGYFASHGIYNLCIRSEQGGLLFGDAQVPPNQIQFEPVNTQHEKRLVDRLVNADRVYLIGITNENIDKFLHLALDKRAELMRGFWDEIKVVFLAQDLLDLVLDHRCQTFDMDKARQNRKVDWGRGVRGVREFFLSCGVEAEPHWECLQFNYLLPFEAQSFFDHENSLISILPLLPYGDNQKGYQIEATFGSSLHLQLTSAIDAIIRTATPIVEFNVYGHAEKSPDGKANFRLGGVVSQRNWRKFIPPEGITPCFPVSFILLHHDIGGVRRVLLQNRTPFNTGGDFNLSLISGKLNDEDFLFPRIANNDYQQLAYSVSNSTDDNMRIKLSKMFGEEINLKPGNLVPADFLEQVWINTAVRELYAELGLRIDPSRLSVPYPIPFLLDRKEGFQLYIKLYTLELQPEELAQIKTFRPYANLMPFTIDKMIEYREKLSVFLNVHLDTHIIPLLHKMGIS